MRLAGAIGAVQLVVRGVAVRSWVRCSWVRCSWARGFVGSPFVGRGFAVRGFVRLAVRGFDNLAGGATISPVTRMRSVTVRLVGNENESEIGNGATRGSWVRGPILGSLFVGRGFAVRGLVGS